MPEDFEARWRTRPQTNRNDTLSHLLAGFWFGLNLAATFIICGLLARLYLDWVAQ